MGRHWYSYNGFGVYDYAFQEATYEGCVSLLKLCNKGYQDNLKEIQEEIHWEPTVDSFNAITFNEDENLSGVTALFIDAIYQQEGIRLTYAYSDDESAVIFEPLYPWMKPTENEQNLTPKKLDDIFCKYFDILGIPKEHQAWATYIDVIGYC